MSNLLFVLILSVLFGGLYAWGFKRLCGERWQFIGTIPLTKRNDGCWNGLNLTYYGLFNANACTLAVLIVYILLAAGGLSTAVIHLVVGLVFALCIPAAKLMARWVEKKAHTFSIGGAAFVGLIAAPWVMAALNLAGPLWGMPPFPIMPALAAIAAGYALGEGSGRLACLSFGCCYGKPLGRFPSVFRPWLAPLSIVYHGGNKKIAYAGALDGQPVIAVPAITAVLYTAAGLIGVLLFLEGRSRAAYLLCVSVTQFWRFASEFLRADHRGAGRISAYQKMALAAVLYAVAVAVAIPPAGSPVHLIAGLRLLWNPVIILACQSLWIGIFLYMGRSQVTGAVISFFVRKDRI